MGEVCLSVCLFSFTVYKEYLTPVIYIFPIVRQINAQNWREFSQTKRLDLTINMGEEESYFVKLPCNISVWFKISFSGHEESNSHVELNGKSSGSIFCNKAGSRTWYGGEKTDFQIDRSLECDEDGENIILE